MLTNDPAEQAAQAAKDKLAQDAVEADRVRKEAAAKEKARLADEAKTLVKMAKDGEISHVHPSTVESHRQAGWKVAG